MVDSHVDAIANLNLHPFKLEWNSDFAFDLVATSLEIHVPNKPDRPIPAIQVPRRDAL